MRRNLEAAVAARRTAATQGQRRPGVRRRVFAAILAATLAAGLMALTPSTASADDPDGHITGTVTDKITGLPLPDICVEVTGDNGFGFEQNAGDGTYDVGGLATGNYTVQFTDCFGSGYLSEYYDDSPTLGGATPVAVTAPDTTADIDAAMGTGGHITGTVTDNITGLPLPNMCVVVTGDNGNGFEQNQTDGTYDVGGLPTGNYTVQFTDCFGSGYLSEYYDDVATTGAATPVAVTAPATTTGIDAAMGTGGHITGTVTDNITGLPLPNMCVVVTGDNGNGFEQNQTDGTYDVGGLPTGNYTVQFTDCFGSGYLSEYYDDVATTGAATPVAVTAPATTTGIDAAMGTNGRVLGTVTDAGSSDPLPGAWVVALRTSDFVIEGGGVADAGGAYDLEAPPGDYYLYLIDPANEHSPGFHGPPTLVTVESGIETTENPEMTTTRGSIRGTVTEDGTGDPLGGSWALALSGTTGATEAVVPTNGAGEFALDRLAPGNHFVGYIDPAGGHVTEFYPNSGNVPESTPVPVTAGAATVADGELSTKNVVPGGSTLSGTVTDDTSGDPIEGAAIVALNAADYSMARGGLTDAAGDYSLDVAAGGYKLAVLDTAGRHDMEWFDNQPANQLALAATVTAPAIADTALSANTGSMSGTVTEDPSGDPIAGALVAAIGPTGLSAGTVTAADGTYTLTGLPAGTYGALFIDPSGARTLEYFDNSPTPAGATAFAVTNGAVTANISAALPAAP